MMRFASVDVNASVNEWLIEGLEIRQQVIANIVHRIETNG